MITSLKNDRVRLVQALQKKRRVRQRERLLVIEGVRLGEEALRTGHAPRFVFYTAAARQDERARTLLDGWQSGNVGCWEVDRAVMDACSGTETPSGLLAVLPIPEIAPPPHPTLTLIPDRLRNPGNLGTLLRTALAAGVDQVVLPPGTVDATNPKVVRGGMGAHFYLPLQTLGWKQIPAAMAGRRVYLAAARSGTPYTAVDWSAPLALIVGGEAEGAGEQARALADAEVFIPMNGAAESLNAAVAAAVILFEIARQRGGR